ncbi:MAG: terminase [Bacillota bacterium]|nr:terminase [Bacillota bacterium]
MAGRGTTGTAKKEAFLRALARLGNVSDACRKARVPRRTVYNWKTDDAEFAQAWAEAEETAADALEREARRRAVKGVLKPVYQGGKLAGHVREYSDTLLIFLLKGARPEKYAERVKNEHSGPGGGPVPVTLELLQERYRHAHGGQEAADQG